MLRWVKKVPGLAPKTVPSLTRLSEQPKNMKGGARILIPSEFNETHMTEWIHTLSLVSQLLQKSRIRCSEGLVAFDDSSEFTASAVGLLPSNYGGLRAADNLEFSGFANWVSESRGQGRQGKDETESNHGAGFVV